MLLDYDKFRPVKIAGFFFVSMAAFSLFLLAAVLEESGFRELIINKKYSKRRYMMKRSKFDLKSSIIGGLAAIMIIMLLGQASTEQNVTDTIVVRQIKIINEKGEEVIVLGSFKERGGIYVKGGKAAIAIGIPEDDGRITLIKEGRIVAHISTAYEGEISLVNKEGERVALMKIEEDHGAMSVYNKAGKSSVVLSSPHGEGIVMVSNKDGHGVGALECDQGEGRISLMDKNLKLGWLQRGGK